MELKMLQKHMYDDYFELRPANPIRRCTVDRVAAHTLYEQSNPYLIFEPDGVCDLTNSKFTQVDERTVWVTGSVFREAKEKTLKLEGVKCSGYRTICPATVYDPLTIEMIDEDALDKGSATCVQFVLDNMDGINKEKIGIKNGGILAKEVSPKISIYNTLITTFGLTYNEYSGVFFM